VGEHAAFVRGRAMVARAGDLFPVRVIRRFIDHSGATQAILIAWNALTSVFPITLAVAAVGGFLLSVAGVTPDIIVRSVFALFPSDTGTQTAALAGIDALQRRALLFAILALLGFVWTGSGLFGAMEEAFGAVFLTPSRPFVRQKLMGLAMMGVFAVLALLAVGTSAVLPLLGQIPGVPFNVRQGWTGVVVQVCVGFLSGVVLYTTIYYFVPNRRQRITRVLPGALFAGATLEALSQLFPTYIRLNQGINMFGREFAFLFVLLAFFYFLGVITIIGACIIAELDPPLGRVVPRQRQPVAAS